ncbi:MAG: thiamine diphosphokinase [Oscillospiraceae bacterium]|nr:thiamine diphosphokinase [Oscillospiraceae bacterium]
MKRAVIVGGAPIGRYDSVRSYLRADDTMIYCDCGLRHAAGLGREADLIVGDFDSHENPHAAAETIVLPHEKDDTDTCYAAKEALRRGFRDFLLLGVSGARLDHTLGNLALLLMLDTAGAKALLVDDFSETEIVSREMARVSDRYPYFSLFNPDGSAKAVTVTGAKYPLTEAALPCEGSLGVSNEPLPGRTAEIRVGEGRLLLVRVRQAG